jgi:uncharacterized membrane protein YhaH (DUF805 family)
MHPVGVNALLRFFFRPAGRIARREYAIGIGVILSVNVAVFSYLLGHGEPPPFMVLFLTILAIPFFVAQLVLVAKRCHDIGLPGSYLLLLFVPVLGLAWFVALGFLPGNPGPNAYGPAPRFAAPGAQEA